MQTFQFKRSAAALFVDLRRRSRHRVKVVRQALRAQRSNSVVFVAGCQRSGTNMVMDLLDSSHETDVYHEHDPRAFDNYELREPRTLARLRAQSRAPVMVVKTLCDLERLPALCADFAPARVLWIYRDYRDVVNSMLVSFRNQSQQIQRLASGRDTSWWGRGLSASNLSLLREFVHPGIDDASAAALQWFVRAGMYFELDHHRATNTMLVNYEWLVRQPTIGAQALYSFTGLRPRADAGREIHPQSVGKRRAPAIEPDIASLCDALMRQLDDAFACQPRLVCTATPDARALSLQTEGCY